jgi:hypothetical protein
VLVVYASMMSGLTAVIAQLSASMAREAAGVLLFAENLDPPVSRVEKGLEIQARVSEWQPAGHVIELRAVPASEISVAELASGMDTAENADLPKKVLPQPRPALTPAALPAARPAAAKPRVAGWIRRVGRTPASVRSDAETTAHLIQRHLRAEM